MYTNHSDPPEDHSQICHGEYVVTPLGRWQVHGPQMVLELQGHKCHGAQNVPHPTVLVSGPQRLRVTVTRLLRGPVACASLGLVHVQNKVLL